MCQYLYLCTSERERKGQRDKERERDRETKRETNLRYTSAKEPLPNSCIHLLRQYLYFCTSKASKLSTSPRLSSKKRMRAFKKKNTYIKKIIPKKNTGPKLSSEKRMRPASMLSRHDSALLVLSRVPLSSLLP